MNSLLHHSTCDVSQLFTPNYDGINVTNLNKVLNEVVKFLDDTQSPTIGLKFLTNICYELTSNNALRLFDNEYIMKHPFFIMIGQTFEMLLTKAIFIPLTDEDAQFFNESSNLIAKLCLYHKKSSNCFNTNDAFGMNTSSEQQAEPISYEKIFITKSLLDKLARIISNDLAINDYEAYNVKYKVIGRLIGLCRELNNTAYNVLLDSIIRCLRTDQYRNIYETIDLQELITNPKQNFFIYECPKFICQYYDQRQDEISDTLCEFIFEHSKTIFEKHLPLLLKNDPLKTSKKHGNQNPKDNRWANLQAIGWHIELLSHLALIPAARLYFITDTHQPILDHIINILCSKSLIKSVSKQQESFDVDVNLVLWAIVLLYNLSFEEKIFYLIQEKEVGNICAKFKNAKNKIIQFASQTLSAILNLVDIDDTEHALNMTQNYLFLIENTLSERSLTFYGIKLDGVLAYLEVMAQNDLIKNEISYDDEDISLLARCVLNLDLDLETVRRPALRIIEAISFGNENCRRRIKENEKLMDYIKDLSVTNDSALGLLANRIQWKIEDETKFILAKTKEQSEISVNASQNNNSIHLNQSFNYSWDLNENKTSNQYDLVISYHHNDRELCDQIYQRLISSRFYRISFDRENAQEIQPMLMAKAIENSSIVLICFSSAYQQSYACRMTAEYAEKQQRPTILVKLDDSHCPNGWLKNILADKSCVDIMKSDMNVVYANLIQHIDEIKRKINIK